MFREITKLNKLIDERKMDAYYKKYKTLIYDKFLSKTTAPSSPASKSKNKRTRRRQNKKGRRNATMRRK